ncbi:MAG TPA: lipid-A-disaccharide synthase [Devosiaceae bacterium]
MTRPIRLFILAGEPSGDRLAADLVSHLRDRLDLEIGGVGGERLHQQGLRSLFPMSDLSVMGFSDVLRRLPLLLWRLREARRALIAFRPDIVVLVDAQEFSARLALGARRLGFAGPMLLYVAPSVWAWRPERAAALKGVFDEVMSLFPFEPATMRNLGGPYTSYVGHPALWDTRLRQDIRNRGRVLLLPGSREGELRRHLPLMRSVAERLAGHPSVSGFTMPTLARLADRLHREVKGWRVEVELATTQQDRESAQDDALLAVACAGTVTLELALSGIPMVTTYLGDRGQARRYTKARPAAISLPNIIMGEQIVPEVILSEPDADRLVEVVTGLVDDTEARRRQLSAFVDLRQRMESGLGEQKREDPADRVLAHIERSSRL